MGAEGFVAPLLGALQACVSVLLTICYGVAAQRVQLIHKSSIEDMAGLGVKVLLPALTLVRLGEQLHAGNVLNYVPVLSSLAFLPGIIMVRRISLANWRKKKTSLGNPLHLCLCCTGPGRVESV